MEDVQHACRNIKTPKQEAGDPRSLHIVRSCHETPAPSFVLTLTPIRVELYQRHVGWGEGLAERESA